MINLKWYRATWLEQKVRDYTPPTEFYWKAMTTDVIAPNKKEAHSLLKAVDLKDKQYLHVRVEHVGSEAQFNETQGQLQLEYEKLDPFGNV